MVGSPASAAAPVLWVYSCPSQDEAAQKARLSQDEQKGVTELTLPLLQRQVQSEVRQRDEGKSCCHRVQGSCLPAWTRRYVLASASCPGLLLMTLT